MEEKILPVEKLELVDLDIYADKEAHIENLRKDIAENGLKTKIKVKKNEETGGYYVTQGYSRVKACIKLGITEIPCIIEGTVDGKETEAVIKGNKCEVE